MLDGASYPPPVINGTYDWRMSKLATLHNILDKITTSSEGNNVVNCLLNNSNYETNDEMFFNIIIDLLTN